MDAASIDHLSDLMPPPRSAAPPRPEPLNQDNGADVGGATIARAVVSGPCGEVDLELGTASFAGVTIGCCTLIAPGELVRIRVLRRFDSDRTLALDPPFDIVAGVVEVDGAADEDADMDAACGGALLSPGTEFTVRIDLDQALDLLAAPTLLVLDDFDVEEVAAA